MELKKTLFFGLYINTHGFPPSAWRLIPKHTPSKQQEFSKSLFSFTGSMLIDLMGMLLLPHLHIQISSARGILRSPWPPPASPWLRSNRVAKSPSRPGASSPAATAFSAPAEPAHRIHSPELGTAAYRIFSRELGNGTGWTDGKEEEEEEGAGTGAEMVLVTRLALRRNQNSGIPKINKNDKKGANGNQVRPLTPPFALRDMRATRPQPDPPGRTFGLSLPSLRHQTQY